MQVEYLERSAFRSRGTRSPAPSGWAYGSDGGLVGDHFHASEHKAKSKAIHATTRDVINENHFELCALASVLQEATSETLIFMELGAGWGGQSLAVTQMVRNSMASPQVKDTWCFAVEAEPGHHGFVCETFRVNSIPGTIVFGAVSDKVHWAKFYSQKPPAANYGQSIRASGNLLVPCYTVDYLMETFHLAHVDMIHMDVQGEEPATLVGAQESMAAGLIDYMLICPHIRPTKDRERIEALVRPWYDIVISIDAKAGYSEIPSFIKPVYHPQDGIILCRRKGL